MWPSKWTIVGCWLIGNLFETECSHGITDVGGRCQKTFFYISENNMWFWIRDSSHGMWQGVNDVSWLGGWPSANHIHICESIIERGYRHSQGFNRATMQISLLIRMPDRQRRMSIALIGENENVSDTVLDCGDWLGVYQNARNSE